MRQTLARKDQGEIIRLIVEDILRYVLMSRAQCARAEIKRKRREEQQH